MSNVLHRTLGSLHVFEFAPSRLGLGIQPLAGGNVRPLTPSAALALYGGVDAAFVGPMFGFAPNDGHRANDGDQGYKTSTAFALQALCLDSRHGIDSPARTQRGLTISVVGGRAIVRDGGSTVDGATCAVQLFPALVRNGHNVHTSGRDTDRTGRAALCVLSSGQIAVVGGGCSMDQLAAACIAAGATDAGYLDGGGSWCAQVRGVGTWQSGRRRPLANWIVVNGDGGVLDAVPAPIAASPWPLLVVGGLAVAGALAFGAHAVLRG